MRSKYLTLRNNVDFYRYSLSLYKLLERDPCYYTIRYERRDRQAGSC